MAAFRSLTFSAYTFGAASMLPEADSADWADLGQAHDDRDVFQASPEEFPVIDIHSL